jgi:hypothetical protein
LALLSRHSGKEILMAETAPDPNNKSVIFAGKAKQAKADALRKRGLISDRQAQKKGLTMEKVPADGEIANLGTPS